MDTYFQNLSRTNEKYMKNDDRTKCKPNISYETMKVDSEISSNLCKDDTYISHWVNRSNNYQDSFIQNAEEYGSVLKDKISSSDTNLTKKSTFSKIFHWDPWMKIRRKSKKNKKEKVLCPQEIKMDCDSSDSSNCNISTYTRAELRNETYGLEYDFRRSLNEIPSVVDNNSHNWERRFKKKVQFQTDVRVIHFDNDKILCHTIEPLKKELDQQLRNIMLRKERAPETAARIKPKAKKSVSSYMSAWRKK